MTLTTWEESLCRILEPNVSTTTERFAALMKLKEAGIPTVVWLCPILPFLNDTAENINRLLDCCEQAGVRGIVQFGMGVTLRQGNREYFYRQLDRHFPGLKESAPTATPMCWKAPTVGICWSCCTADAGMPASCTITPAFSATCRRWKSNSRSK